MRFYGYTSWLRDIHRNRRIRQRNADQARASSSWLPTTKKTKKKKVEPRRRRRAHLQPKLGQVEGVRQPGRRCRRGRRIRKGNRHRQVYALARSSPRAPTGCQVRLAPFQWPPLPSRFFCVLRNKREQRLYDAGAKARAPETISAKAFPSPLRGVFRVFHQMERTQRVGWPYGCVQPPWLRRSILRFLQRVRDRGKTHASNDFFFVRSGGITPALLALELEAPAYHLMIWDDAHMHNVAA